jgi:hypothetical protein
LSRASIAPLGDPAFPISSSVRSKTGTASLLFPPGAVSFGHFELAPTHPPGRQALQHSGWTSAPRVESMKVRGHRHRGRPPPGLPEDIGNVRPAGPLRRRECREVTTVLFFEIFRRRPTRILSAQATLSPVTLAALTQEIHEPRYRPAGIKNCPTDGNYPRSKICMTWVTTPATFRSLGLTLSPRDG